jgi:hypothetical protein
MPLLPKRILPSTSHPRTATTESRSSSVLRHAAAPPRSFLLTSTLSVVLFVLCYSSLRLQSTMIEPSSRRVNESTSSSSSPESTSTTIPKTPRPRKAKLIDKLPRVYEIPHDGIPAFDPKHQPSTYYQVPAAIELLKELNIQPVAFPKWQGDFPCHRSLLDAPRGSDHREVVGLKYIKIHKCASSTGADITVHMAANQGQRYLQPHPDARLPSQRCASHQHHFPASTTLQNIMSRGQQPRVKVSTQDPNVNMTVYRENFLKHRSRRFWWSSVRDPTRRSASEFYHFAVSRSKVDPNDANFTAAALKIRPNYQSQYLNPWSAFRNLQPNTKAAEVINGILHAYDFIGVAERTEESAVVLQLIFGLPLLDVLYMDEKVSGGFDDGAFAEAGCTLIQSPTVSAHMQAFFASAQWRERVYMDELLHQAVNQSLDLTIDALGRHRFDQHLTDFRAARQFVNEYCRDKVVLPCTNATPGDPPHLQTDCLMPGMGCGFDCMEEALQVWNKTGVSSVQ